MRASVCVCVCLFVLWDISNDSVEFFFWHHPQPTILI